MFLPDAPWIRDAMINGMSEEEPVFCPCCGEECSVFIKDTVTGNIIGCDMCTEEVDPYEEMED